MKVAVITEAYNEEKLIAHVLSQIPDDYDVYVVDDGSTDNTAQIARNAKMKLIRHPANLGQALAFITGLRVALMGDYEYIIHLDGDNQHDPREIPKFIKKFAESDYDVVVGSRIIGSQETTSLLRGIFLPIVNKIIRKITRYEVTDYLCGFRGYKCSTLRAHFDIFDYFKHPNYNATEMFLLFSQRNFRIGEIPVHVKARMYGKSTKGEFTYGIQIINSIIRYAFNKRNHMGGNLR